MEREPWEVNSRGFIGLRRYYVSTNSAQKENQGDMLQLDWIRSTKEEFWRNAKLNCQLDVLLYSTVN